MDGRSATPIHPTREYCLPEVPATVIAAVRAGTANAVVMWADALAERGAAPAAAELLRWLPSFHDRIAEEVRLVAPSAGFVVNCFAWSEHAAWVIGDCDCEIQNRDTRNLDELLAAWNELHPAVEWLYRRLGLPAVAVQTHRVASGERGPGRDFNLAAGEHLEPFEPGVRVTRLRTRGWVPEE